MGCAYCNRSSEDTNYYSIESIENGLELSNVSSNFLNTIFNKFSSDNAMTLPQFQRAFRELNIDYSKHYLFYNLFIDQSLTKFNVISYKAQQLSTLGILLGNCSDKDKLTLLFKNYDRDGSTRLSRRETECLVTDVLSIILIYIPKYAYLILNSLTLKNYIGAFE